MLHTRSSCPSEHLVDIEDSDVLISALLLVVDLRVLDDDGAPWKIKTTCRRRPANQDLKKVGAEIARCKQ